ncbi:SH3 domain-containing protein [Magnetococcales bacterium HHB-1]
MRVIFLIALLLLSPGSGMASDAQDLFLNVLGTAIEMGLQSATEESEPAPPPPRRMAPPPPQRSSTVKGPIPGPFYATTAVNVRSGPGSHHARLFTLQKNQRIWVTGQQRGWAIFDVDETRVGYVSGRYIRAGEPVVRKKAIRPAPVATQAIPAPHTMTASCKEIAARRSISVLDNGMVRTFAMPKFDDATISLRAGVRMHVGVEDAILSEDNKPDVTGGIRFCHNCDYGPMFAIWDHGGDVGEGDFNWLKESCEGVVKGEVIPENRKGEKIFTLPEMGQKRLIKGYVKWGQVEHYQFQGKKGERISMRIQGIEGHDKPRFQFWHLTDGNEEYPIPDEKDRRQDDWQHWSGLLPETATFLVNMVSEGRLGANYRFSIERSPARVAAPPPPPPPALKTGFLGEWQSKWGNVRFHQNGNRISGTYDYYGGRLDGMMVDDKTFEGLWVQDSNARKCRSKRLGSHYWGRVTFTFNKDRFRGQWGYCNGATSHNDWSGWR